MRASIARALYYRLTLSLLLLWIGVVTMVTVVLHFETEEVFDSNLQETAQRVLSLSIHELENHPGSQEMQPAEHDEYLTYQVFSSNGDMVMRSHIAPEIPFSVPSNNGFYRREDQYFYVDSTRDGKYVIKVAERRSHRQHTLRKMVERLLFPLVALLPLAILLIRVSIRSVRTSIDDLDQELSKRGSKDLHPVQLEETPVELLGLATAINSLMARLKSALDAERHFSANSAHELRTPIAAAMAQLDVLRDELVLPEHHVRVNCARQMIERLEQMTIKLLQLARADAGSAIDTNQMDLLPVTEMLIHDLSFRSTREVEFDRPSQPVLVLGDVDAIGIAVQNLLENADRYATPSTPIRISISSAGTLTLINDCVAVPPELLKSLRDRFVRGDQSKSGSGIGLSIVDTILGQCGALLTFESPCFENGRGFKVIVNFKQ